MLCTSSQREALTPQVQQPTPTLQVTILQTKPKFWNPQFESCALPVLDGSLKADGHPVLRTEGQQMAARKMSMFLSLLTSLGFCGFANFYGLQPSSAAGHRLPLGCLISTSCTTTTAQSLQFIETGRALLHRHEHTPGSQHKHRCAHMSQDLGFSQTT